LNFNVFEKLYNKLEKPLPNKGILGLLNLETLEMCGNNINDLTGIQMLKGLKILVLKENNINKFDFFDGLPNLIFLDLSHNKFRNVDKSNIGLLPNLKTLLLDQNYLKNINGFVKISSLNYLSCDNNKIQEMSQIEKLGDLENLKDLNLTNNPITKSHNYRLTIIRRYQFLQKLDTFEIIKEERESANIENSINAIIDSKAGNQPQNQGSGLNSEKYPMKVNFVNLDLMFGGGKINYMEDLAMVRNQIGGNNFDGLNVINLPQINIQNFGVNNNYQKINRNKAQGGFNNVHNVQSGKTYRTQKIKLNSIPLGGLFKHIGEVISNNHDSAVILPKFNAPTNKKERPKSKK